MRVRIGDVVMVRLAQDSRKLYMGAVTALSRGSGYVWELDSEERGMIGMRLEFHSDDERQVTIPRDKIESVMSPEEWQQDEAAGRFILNNQKGLMRLADSHYKGQTPPWEKGAPSLLP